MSEEQKRLLERQLWNIADTLRGKMDADEFRDYILGFIFYKYLSEKMHLYANKILQEDGIKYQDIDENSQEGREFLEAIKEEALLKLGTVAGKPSESGNNTHFQRHSCPGPDFCAEKGKKGIFSRNPLLEMAFLPFPDTLILSHMLN
jgi:hypothetical protein